MQTHSALQKSMTRTARKIYGDALFDLSLFGFELALCLLSLLCQFCYSRLQRNCGAEEVSGPLKSMSFYLLQATAMHQILSFERRRMPYLLLSPCIFAAPQCACRCKHASRVEAPAKRLEQLQRQKARHIKEYQPVESPFSRTRCQAPCLPMDRGNLQAA